MCHKIPQRASTCLNVPQNPSTCWAQVVQQESNQYSDPITQFLECLFVQYDFEGAQQKLKLCEQARGGARMPQQTRHIALHALIIIYIMYIHTSACTSKY